MNLRYNFISVSVALVALTACASPHASRVISQNPEAMVKSTDHAGEADHAPYGHASAQYVCGGKEVLTRYSLDETTLTYDGVEGMMTLISTPSGEVFSGQIGGRQAKFDGKAHSAVFEIGNQKMTCEKITCVPLGGPL